MTRREEDVGALWTWWRLGFDDDVMSYLLS